MNLRLMGIIIALVAMAFFMGRYTSPEKIVTKVEIKTVEVVKTVESKKEDSETTIEQVIERSGETRTITHIVTKRDDEIKITKFDKKSELDTKIVDNGRGVNVSALAGYKDGLVYGAAFNKNIIGPITVGAWGLSNASFGISIGLQL